MIQFHEISIYIFKLTTDTIMSREMAVVTLEKVSPRSRSDGVFPMLLGVGCSLVRAG